MSFNTPSGFCAADFVFSIEATEKINYILLPLIDNHFQMLKQIYETMVGKRNNKFLFHTLNLFQDLSASVWTKWYSITVSPSGYSRGIENINKWKN